MFILDTTTIPTTAAELGKVLDASLRRAIRLPGGSPVSITGELPQLTGLAVNVSGGVIDTSKPMPDPKTPAKTQPGPGVDAFSITGDPIGIEDVRLHFQLSARGVVFAYAKNPSGQWIAALMDAAEGSVSVRLTQAELEAAALALARKVAGGAVAVQAVSVVLKSIDSTTVDVLVNLTARKFVTAMVRIAGRLSVDDKMVATATNLKVTADGLVGGIAVNLLRPFIQKMEGKPLPLLTFSMGKVQLQGIDVKTTNGVTIAAEFGGAK
jgi:hypothetical protein